MVWRQSLGWRHSGQRVKGNLPWDWIYIQLFIWNSKFLQSFKPCVSQKKQRFCNRMMTCVYVFGGILCGLHKVHKTPRIPSILKIWASNVRHAVTWTFWPEAFYVWHNLILRCKFSQNLPTNDSLQKDPVKLQVPENCILPGFFKILPPRRHSLGQRDLKGCGILSFSP